MSDEKRATVETLIRVGSGVYVVKLDKMANNAWKTRQREILRRLERGPENSHQSSEGKVTSDG